MSAGVAAVTALDNAAFELCKKGHYTRSLEKSRAAVVAAQALGLTDCLIYTCMQLDEINALALHGQAPGVPADEKRKSQAASLVILHSVIELLKRRKAAGTLLEGACRPEEVAFNAAPKHLRRNGRRRCHASAAPSAYRRWRAPPPGAHRA
jgi:hypothetical protein